MGDFMQDLQRANVVGWQSGTNPHSLFFAAFLASISESQASSPCAPTSTIVLTDCVVGPPGLEPGTKGFACSEGFPTARTISSPSAFAGGVRDALACYQGHCSPQVVSAPSGGVPPAWLRIATGRAAEVSLNSSRFHPDLPVLASPFDESSALTIELWART